MRKGNAFELERSELRLREWLSPLEGDWLTGCLVSSHGVQRAYYSADDPPHVIVEYDLNRMSTTDLMDVIYRCGLHAETVSATRRPGIPRS